MKKFINILIPVFVLMILVLPIFTFAVAPPSDEEGLIPCGTDATNQKECTFRDFMILIDNIIDFTIIYLALPIAAIMFAYAGLVLVTAPGDESRTKAKNIFLNSVVGLVLAVGAWLIVKTFLSIAGYNDIKVFFG